jgi:hypothetical protein
VPVPSCVFPEALCAHGRIREPGFMDDKAVQSREFG